MMSALFRIIRPGNVLITFLSVLTAAWLVSDTVFTPLLLRAALAASFVTAAANIINDIFDLDIDRVNRPGRILPSGRLSLPAARLFYKTLNMVALALVVDRLPLFLIIAGSQLLLYVYSRSFKKMMLIGNVLVAFMGGLAFVYGALAAGGVTAGLFPALFAALFHFSRELIKDLQDVEGDRKYQAHTFAVRFGAENIVKMVDAVFILLSGILLLPFLLSMYNVYYIYMVVPGVMLVMFYCSWQLHKDPGTETLSRMSALLKADMLIGLVSIIVGVKL
ncbi:MAG TPA: hypothetical protein ENJ15_02395 [Caldithrix abyssi]|uniref:Geranylgeranylglycerol-phosphate geranylgeranyltransferase n=1 Tax=Caldithrix abyssi TaxID=187145 RepID=A0A7V5VED7_CALAY|nr:hypothetical protein [Caldithrix abyssi]